MRMILFTRKNTFGVSRRAEYRVAERHIQYLLTEKKSKFFKRFHEALPLAHHPNMPYRHRN